MRFKGLFAAEVFLYCPSAKNAVEVKKSGHCFRSSKNPLFQQARGEAPYLYRFILIYIYFFLL